MTERLLPGERAARILLDVAERWEQDPHRAKKLTWVGYDSSDCESEDYELNSDEEEIEERSYSDDVETMRYYEKNLEDFVVPDDVPEQDIPWPSGIVGAAPSEDLEPKTNANTNTVIQHATSLVMDDNEMFSADDEIVQKKESTKQQQPPPPAAPNMIGKVFIPVVHPSDEKIAEVEGTQCCICQSRDINVVLTPCGHAISCIVCIDRFLRTKLAERKPLHCPTCDSVINQVFRLFQ